MSRNNKPSVSHKSYSSIPFMPTGIGPTLHETTVKHGNRSSSGVGWTRKEANDKAGRAYNGKKGR